MCSTDCASQRVPPCPLPMFGFVGLNWPIFMPHIVRAFAHPSDTVANMGFLLGILLTRLGARAFGALLKCQISVLLTCPL